MIDPSVRRSEQDNYQQRQQRKNGSQRAKKLNSAKKKAKKSFAPTPMGKAVNKCPLAKNTPPLLTTPKPPTEVRKNCSLIRTDVLCEHKGRRAQSNLLEVVPSKSGISVSSSPSPLKSVKGSVSQGSSEKGDNLNLQATMHQNCGSHPIWKVKDDKNAIVKQQTGEKLSVEVLPPKITERDAPNIFGILWWLKDIEPRKYTVECDDHNGASLVTNIHVYPYMESKFSVDFEKDAKKNKETESALERSLRIFQMSLMIGVEKWREFIPQIKELKVKILKGSVSIKNSWAEDAKTHRAYWEGEISFSLEPLFSITGKCAVTPTIVPPVISKYVDIYVYISFKGEINAKTGLKWKGSSFNQSSSVLTGAISVTIGAEAFVGKKFKAIGVDVNGGTKLTAEGKLNSTTEPQISLDGKITWDPLTVRFNLEVLDGWIKVSKEKSLFNKMEIFSGSHKFLSS